MLDHTAVMKPGLDLKMHQMCNAENLLGGDPCSQIYFLLRVKSCASDRCTCGHPSFCQSLSVRRKMARTFPSAG